MAEGRQAALFTTYINLSPNLGKNDSREGLKGHFPYFIIFNLSKDFFKLANQSRIGSFNYPYLVVMFN
jgi:hypothetical protein